MARTWLDLFKKGTYFIFMGGGGRHLIEVCAYACVKCMCKRVCDMCVCVYLCTCLCVRVKNVCISVCLSG